MTTRIKNSVVHTKEGAQTHEVITCDGKIFSCMSRERLGYFCTTLILLRCDGRLVLVTTSGTSLALTHLKL